MITTLPSRLISGNDGEGMRCADDSRPEVRRSSPAPSGRISFRSPAPRAPILEQNDENHGPVQTVGRSGEFAMRPMECAENVT
ncbi:hypothetical protein [Nakamurella leprariae]|uniref:Uncharacterized protein n=1 Tax=Nakamurella leprariae TaxID=2803911 RepID=A0A939C0N1_9ACTN|nr:hypothetical protein [Nakamurella leprariae]MBM9468941.1 hypothetical protein [Nakamurella leprariae]